VVAAFSAFERFEAAITAVCATVVSFGEAL